MTKRRQQKRPSLDSRSIQSGQKEPGRCMKVSWRLLEMHLQLSSTSRNSKRSKHSHSGLTPWHPPFSADPPPRFQRFESIVIKMYGAIAPWCSERIRIAWATGETGAAALCVYVAAQDSGQEARRQWRQHSEGTSGLATFSCPFSFHFSGVTYGAR